MGHFEREFRELFLPFKLKKKSFGTFGGTISPGRSHGMVPAPQPVAKRKMQTNKTGRR